MKRLIWPFFVLVIILILGFLWYREGVMPVDRTNKTPVIFVINKGEGLNIIANRLENEKLIRNALVFRLMLKKLGLEMSIQAGDFQLSQTMSADQIADELTHGTLDVWVTVIEGWRREEIAQALAKSHSLPETVFVEKTSEAEGYLFPDTYLVPKKATVEYIIELMRRNFNQKVTQDVVDKAVSKGLTLNQLVTLASLVERETQDPEARRMVAGVILNRLNEGMKLDIDASVQYALGYDISQKSWWKKNLTLADLAVDSPYNTYINPGLPPGPIANPGLDSILAVVEATDTNYIYYLTDPKGIMHYSKTLKEHEQKVNKYLR